MVAALGASTLGSNHCWGDRHEVLREVHLPCRTSRGASPTHVFEASCVMTSPKKNTKLYVVAALDKHLAKQLKT